MNKRIITSILLVFCMTLVAVFAVSCDEATNNSIPADVSENSADASLPADDSSAPVDDGKVTYTVTVLLKVLSFSSATTQTAKCPSLPMPKVRSPLNMMKAIIISPLPKQRVIPSKLSMISRMEKPSLP